MDVENIRTVHREAGAEAQLSILCGFKSNTRHFDNQHSFTDLRQLVYEIAALRNANQGHGFSHMSQPLNGNILVGLFSV